MEKRKNKIKNIIVTVLALLGAAAMVLLPVFFRASQEDEESGESILSARVEKGSVRTTISGGGALSAGTPLGITVPHGVEVTQYLVKNGDEVQQGQPLAALDKNSVMNTIVTVQNNLDYIDRRLSNSHVSLSNATLKAAAKGRVKAVYCAAGDPVEDVMRAHGALMVISLDGLMALEIETGTPLSLGEEVRVTLSGGRTYPGRVERQLGTVTSVTLTDDGPELGDTAAVSLPDGTELGQGVLQVHAPWRLTASSGTVTAVYVRRGEKVGRNYGLCALKDVAGTGVRETMAAERREYENMLNELFALYEKGALTAPADGVAAGIREEKLGMMRAQGEEYTLLLLAEGEGEPEDPNGAATTFFDNRRGIIQDVGLGYMTIQIEENTVHVGSYGKYSVPDSGRSVHFSYGQFSGRTKFFAQSADGTWQELTATEDDMSYGALVSRAVYLCYRRGDPMESPPRWILFPRPPKGRTGGAAYGGGPEAPFEMYDLTEVEVMNVTPVGDMTVEVSIDELDILSVSVGQEAEISVDALPGRSFVGHVKKIDPNGSTESGTTRYTVTITVDRDENMLAGMNATAILTVGVTEDILTLPAAALSEKGGKTVVYTGWDPTAGTLLFPQEITTGISDGTTVEITSGLREGERVWYSYYEGAALPELAALPGERA